MPLRHIPLLVVLLTHAAWSAAQTPAPPSADGASAATRAEFLKLIDRPKVAPAAEWLTTTSEDGIERGTFSFAADSSGRVPGLWAKPAGATGRLPVVIMLHGTGGKKEDLRAQMNAYAAAGFLALAIDAPRHGARTKTGGGGDEYQAAIVQAWRDGKTHPFFYDTVWDVMRLLDYLETRGDVDASRIGLMGISKGGIETYLTAAADPRIAAAVPFIGVQSFRWALNNDKWQNRVETIPKAVADAAKEAGVEPVDAVFVAKFYERVAPGLAGKFDGPAMLPLIAPRPLLVIVGDSDARTPLPAVELCIEAARPGYAAAQADRLKLIAQPNTPHRVTPAAYDAARAWFVQWLKPVPPAQTNAAQDRVATQN